MGRASIVDARGVSGPAKGIVGEERERFCRRRQIPSIVRTRMYVN